MSGYVDLRTAMRRCADAHVRIWIDFHFLRLTELEVYSKLRLLPSAILATDGGLVGSD